MKPPGRMSGSSPRVRGKLFYRHAEPIGVGLIPARAGKTPRRVGRGSACPAHPRACGENQLLGQSWTPSPGSSPRVRGKRGRDDARPPARRLIPARAGKTGRNDNGLAFHKAHPRACGENYFRQGEAQRRSGSSPRVRGKLSLLSFGATHARLIPARAGKTSAPTFGRSSPPAHPRACGENRVAEGIVSPE